MEFIQLHIYSLWFILQEYIVEQLKAEEQHKPSGDVKNYVIRPIATFAAPYFRDRKGMVRVHFEQSIFIKKVAKFVKVKYPFV